jgi:arylsulfatase A-like enzyme
MRKALSVHAPAESVSAHRPNVVLVVCDTLRPDLVSTYGGPVESDAFETLARRGTTFDRAYAAGPGSSISHAALFSGQYPSTSGVGGQVDVPADVPLVAAHLRDHGYETFGMPGPSRIGSHWGYDRGFDEYLEKWSDIPSSPTLTDLGRALDDPELVKPMPAEVLRRLRYGDDNYTSYLLDVFERKVRALDGPYFAFLNLTTVHTPYDPPRPYKRRATPRLDRPRTGLGDLLGGTERFDADEVRLDRLTEAQVHEGVPRYYADRSYLTDAELDVLRSWYRASARYLDDQLSATLRALRDAGEFDDTVVVLTADHGEGLGEHGLLKHMYLHFESVLRVPLVVAGPDVPAGERREEFASLVDVFPTVCDLTGVEPPVGLDGRSLFGGEPRSAVFAENGPRLLSDAYHDHLSPEALNHFRRGLKSIRTGDYLFTVDSAGEERLYVLPDEREVPLSEGPVDELRTALWNELGDSFPPGSQSDDQMSAAVESNLRRLGYLE